jgi:hypothetical protein
MWWPRTPTRPDSWRRLDVSRLAACDPATRSNCRCPRRNGSTPCPIPSIPMPPYKVHPTYCNSLPGHSRESQNIAESMYRQSQVCKLLPPFLLSSQDGMEPSPSKMELKNNTQRSLCFVECAIRSCPSYFRIGVSLGPPPEPAPHAAGGVRGDGGATSVEGGGPANPSLYRQHRDSAYERDSKLLQMCAAYVQTTRKKLQSVRMNRLDLSHRVQVQDLCEK